MARDKLHGLVIEKKKKSGLEAVEIDEQESESDDQECTEIGVHFRIEDISEEYVCKILSNDIGDTLEYLISKGLDIHHIGKNNRNILHLLAGELISIESCTKIKPYCDQTDVNQQDSDGNTPIMVSIEHEGYLVSYFLERGADVNLRNRKGLTPLMIAADYSDYITVTQLIEAGADVNIRVQDGRTALQFLDSYDPFLDNYLACLKLILQNGGYRFLDDKDLEDISPFQRVLGKGLYLLWYFITQNCSFSLNLYMNEEFEFLNRYCNYRLKVAKLFYLSGASKQLIQDIFKLDNDEENEFNCFCNSLGLEELCRRQIRVSIGPGIEEKLQTLKYVAPKLIQFICLRDLIPSKYFDISTVPECCYYDNYTDDFIKQLFN